MPGTKFFDQRKVFGLHHSGKQPFCVVETENFPKKDIDKALRLFLWIDVLTYYYPAIAQFFHTISSGYEEGMYINKLEEWIAAINQQFILFDSEDKIVDIAASGSVQKWNKLKGKLLRKASSAENAFKIYSAIQEKESPFYARSMERTINLGVKVFKHLVFERIDSVEFRNFERLPSAITKEFHIDEIRDIFSRYKR